MRNSESYFFHWESPGVVLNFGINFMRNNLIKAYTETWQKEENEKKVEKARKQRNKKRTDRMAKPDLTLQARTNP